MRIVVDYGTHQHEAEWIDSGLHCPNCGVESVWCEDDAGDYYVGTGHICVTCGHTFTIQGPYPIDYDADIQRLTQIKQAVCSLKGGVA